MLDLSKLKLNIDDESVNIYYDNGKEGEEVEDREHLHIVYWHIEEVEEDATVMFSIINAIQLFYTNPQELIDKLNPPALELLRQF